MSADDRAAWHGQQWTCPRCGRVFLQLGEPGTFYGTSAVCGFCRTGTTEADWRTKGRDAIRRGQRTG